MRVEIEGAAIDSKWRRDNGSDHREGMLEAEEERKEDGDFIIGAVERGLVVAVFAVQWPDIGGDEVELVLGQLVGAKQLEGGYEQSRRAILHDW